MDHYQKIISLVKEKGFTGKFMAEKVNMTETGYYAMLRNKTMSVEVLQKIAVLLGKPISTFFQEYEDEKSDNFTLSEPSVDYKKNSQSMKQNQSNPDLIEFFRQEITLYRERESRLVYELEECRKGKSLSYSQA